MNVQSVRRNPLVNKKWTIDADKPPYYPNGIPCNDPGNKYSLPASLYDSPYFGGLAFYVIDSILSMDFETCAVCSVSKSPNGATGVGDVFGCVKWGHSFQLAGAFFNVHVSGWKRYVESDVWSSDEIVVGGPPGTNDPTHKFKGITNEPSAHMVKFLNKYFP